MKLSLTDKQITINGFGSSCKCKYKHCLLCSGDNLISPVPFEKLPQVMEINRKISRFSGYQNRQKMEQQRKHT